MASALFALLYAVFSVILMLNPLLGLNKAGNPPMAIDLDFISPVFASLLLTVAVVPVALALVPAARLNRKFLMILLGLGLLLALNEITKLGFGTPKRL